MLLLPKAKRAMPGNLPKSKTLSEIGEHWTEKRFHSFVVKYSLFTSTKHTKNTLFWVEVQFMNVRLGGARSDHWSLKG